MLGSFRRRGCTCKKKRCTCGSKWTYRYHIIDAVTGKRKQKETRGFDTKPEVEAEAKRILTMLELGTYVEEKDISFANFADQWISMYEKSGKKISTVDIRKARLKVIKRHFNQIKIKDITRLQYQTMLNDLFEKGIVRKDTKKGYARKTIESIHETCSLLFKKAVELEVISSDITSTAKIPTKMKTVEELENKVDIPKFMEKHELKKFLDAAQQFGYLSDYPVFYTMAYTGVRPGEAIALKLSDINFDELYISITKTLYSLKGKGAKFILQTPKSEKSERTVDIDQEVLSVIKSYRSALKVFKMENRNRYNDSDYVFVNVCKIPGRHLTLGDVERRMRILLKHAGISPELTPHSLRHTHISLLAEAGVSLDEIMDRVGHEDSKVTKLIYLHVTKTRKKKAAEMFSSFMQLQ